MRGIARESCGDYIIFSFAPCIITREIAFAPRAVVSYPSKPQIIVKAGALNCVRQVERMLRSEMMHDGNPAKRGSLVAGQEGMSLRW